MFKVTGLWLNESGEGEKYFSGNIGGMRVLVFKNSFKEEGSNEPDYNLFFAENRKKDTPKLADVPEDDVPF